jgi:cholesterol oxidase
MPAENSAIVIGTGFGGSVSACRLAQAGFEVTVLERGRDYRQSRLRAGAPGAYDFPRENSSPDGWYWCPDLGQHGLLDIMGISEMEHVQSAGLGGGSLIYANVHLRMPADGFEFGWPEGYTRAALDPYYDLVAYMLDVAPIPEDRRPPKTVAFTDAAKRLGRSQYFIYPQLAVNFGTPQAEATNRFGQVQEGCRYCGECIVGCRYRAKNTLDLNYLAEAERRGARIHTLCHVRRIQELAGGGYRVTYRDITRGEDLGVEARHVFVCAGAVNSTELLLRCRDEYRSLTRLGRGLGTRYSGNGDALYFGFDTRDRLEPSNGPTITTALLFDRTENGVRSWFLVEEGGYPPVFNQYARGIKLLDQAGEAGGLLHGGLREMLAAKVAAAGTLAGADDANVAVYLCMGRDRAMGRLRLLPGTFKLALEWDLAPNVALYNAQERLTTDFTREFGGKPALNPVYRFLRVPGTVHSLGGCPMGASPDDSVTDVWGQVHDYPGLYVLDGGILPESTGVNPTATIAAVVERNIEAFIRRTRSEPSWKTPDAAAAGQRERLDPLAGPVSLAVAGTPPPKTPALGTTFAESMGGFVHRGHQPPDDYRSGERAARATGAEGAKLALTVTITDLDAFLNDPNHIATAAGRLVYPPLTGDHGAAVIGGVFSLFSQTDSPAARRVTYRLPFHGSDGHDYLLDGYVDVSGEGPLALWPALTTVYTVIRGGHDPKGAVVATGILRITWADVLGQLESCRVTGTDDPVEKAQARARLGNFLNGALWDVFAATGPLAALRRLWLQFRLWLRTTFDIRARE